MSTTASVFPATDELDELLVGPDSITWQRASDSRLYLVMLYALLLQVAHPTVGAGVSDYSDFERRPWNRLLRTIDYVALLVYGGGDAAPAGRRLRELHKRFRGTRADGERYSALEPTAYAWVHATLIETYVAGHAHFGTPMRGTELEAFYSQYRRLGRLIGVRDRDLPDTWAGFRDYFARMTREELTRTDAVDQVMRALRDVPPPPIPVPQLLWRAVRVPASAALRIGSIGLMDPELRDRLEIPWTRFDEGRFRTMGVATRSLGPVMPRALKITGPAQLKWRRAAIARGPLGDGSAA